MITEQEIRKLLYDALENLFEIDPAKITGNANLYEDLEIDSIDAIDLLDHIKRRQGRHLCRFPHRRGGPALDRLNR